MKATGLPALADDSGIAVDALNGEPGIYSARYGFDDSLEKVIEEIERNKGTQFDPEIADKFLEILNNDYGQIEQIMNKYL